MSDTAGILAMCAMDHRGSLQRMIRPEAPDRVSFDDLVAYKRDLTECLAPAATALLLDPIYGAAQAVAAGVLPGTTALLVSLEQTGYERDAEGRVTALLPDWSVEKVRRMGAAAAKLLLYYRPDAAENAARQRELVRSVAQACAQVDLPFVLEPIAYPLPGPEAEPAAFAGRKADLVVRSARELTALGVDVLKAEFPADLRYERDDGKLGAACERVNDASQVPWILLSAGVSFEDFARQVEIACRAGASGFLGGRAIWEEATRLADAAQRRRWLRTVGTDRLRRLHDIAGQHGRPWWRRWGASPASAVEVPRDWYVRY